MKSSASVVTDSIENQSLPSIPVYRELESGCTESRAAHRTRSAQFQNAFHRVPTPASSRLTYVQRPFANTSSVKQSKTPELNKINEYVVLKVYEHRNFGKSPSTYSRMSEDISISNIPKCRSFVYNRLKLLPNYKMDSVRCFFFVIITR